MDEQSRTEFPLSPARRRILEDCIASSDGVIAPGRHDFDWWGSMFSLRTVVYESGRIARLGDEIRHDVDPVEWERCRTLAREATKRIGNTGGFGSEGAVTWEAFWIVANRDDPPRKRITPAFIRERFGGTILPIATLEVQPISEAGKWWGQILARAESELGSDAKERGLPRDRWRNELLAACRANAEHWPPPKPARGHPNESDPTTASARNLLPWLRLMYFFSGPEFVHAAFVEIGDYSDNDREPKETWPLGMEMWPTCLPRLFLGLTPGGSLAGLFAYVVQT